MVVSFILNSVSVCPHAYLLLDHNYSSFRKENMKCNHCFEKDLPEKEAWKYTVIVEYSPIQSSLIEGLSCHLSTTLRTLAV